MDVETKLCTNCGRTLKITAFKGFKTKNGYHRSKLCRTCASKEPVSETQVDSSTLLGIKIQVGRLTDRYSSLERDYGAVSVDLQEFKEEVLEGIKAINGRLAKLESA